MKSVKDYHFDSIDENVGALFGGRRDDGMIPDLYCTHNKDYALRIGEIHLYAFHRAVIHMRKPTSLTIITVILL